MGTIGSLDYTNEERIELAKKSLDWSCNVCGKVKDLLKDREENDQNIQKDEQKLTEMEEKDKEMLKMINFKVRWLISDQSPYSSLGCFSVCKKFH